MQISRRRQFLIAAAGAAMYASFTRRGFADPHASFVSLRQVATAKGIEFGFALDPTRLQRDSLYRELVAQQANIVVPENALKWQAVHPAPDQYDFDGADVIANFARAHDQRMRGHTFCWHRALPAWVYQYVTRRNAEAVLVGHIRMVASRYQGRISSWDVVNEAIQLKDGLPGGMRNAFWYQMLGPDYVEIAFQAAHSADPSAVLCYNDYGLESDTPEAGRKRTAVLALLQHLKQRGTPIGALGLQSHLRAGHGQVFGAGLVEFIKAVRDLGLSVYVTELDVDDSVLSGPDAMRDAIVADTYRRYLDTVLAAGAVSTIVTWGVWDSPNRTGATATNGPVAQRPLVFGPQGAIKPASWVVEHCLERAPRVSPPSF